MACVLALVIFSFDLILIYLPLGQQASVPGTSLGIPIPGLAVMATPVRVLESASCRVKRRRHRAWTRSVATLEAGLGQQHAWPGSGRRSPPASDRWSPDRSTNDSAPPRPGKPIRPTEIRESRPTRNWRSTQAGRDLELNSAHPGSRGDLVWPTRDPEDDAAHPGAGNPGPAESG